VEQCIYASLSVCLIARVRQQLSVLEIVQTGRNGLIIIGRSLPFSIFVTSLALVLSRLVSLISFLRNVFHFLVVSLSCSSPSSPGLIDLGRSYIALEQSQSVNGSKWEVTRLRGAIYIEEMRRDGATVKESVNHSNIHQLLH